MRFLEQDYSVNEGMLVTVDVVKDQANEFPITVEISLLTFDEFQNQSLTLPPVLGDVFDTVQQAVGNST